MSIQTSPGITAENFTPLVDVQLQTIFPLQSGDHLTRAEFERRYSAMPNLKRAELIEGVVYVPSPVSNAYSHAQLTLAGCFLNYISATANVAGGDNGTTRLDLDNEPQPDLFLRITKENGGQSTIAPDGVIDGAPELIAEIAASSASYDLHSKKEVYRRNGVREYIVWRVLENAIDWFVLRDGVYVPLAVGEDEIHRSEIFPGLWLDTTALLAGDLSKVLGVLQQGIASPEHAAFVERLSQIKRP